MRSANCNIYKKKFGNFATSCAHLHALYWFLLSSIQPLLANTQGKKAPSQWKIPAWESKVWFWKAPPVLACGAWVDYKADLFFVLLWLFVSYCIFSIAYLEWTVLYDLIKI